MHSAHTLGRYRPSDFHFASRLEARQILGRSLSYRQSAPGVGLLCLGEQCRPKAPLRYWHPACYHPTSRAGLTTTRLIRSASSFSGEEQCFEVVLASLSASDIET